MHKNPHILGFGLALGLACGGAAAQSSVTLYGVVDLGIQHSRAGGVGNTTQMISGGNATSRLGIRGREDMGDGLYAGFNLESSLNADSGTGRPSNTNNQASGAGTNSAGLTFDRMAFVSLGHVRYGELRMGHDFMPHHYNSIVFDPFSAVGVARAGNLTLSAVGSGPLFTTVTGSNTASYWLPKDMGGVYGMAMVGLGENAAGSPNEHDGNFVGGRLGYATGPFDIAAAVTRTRYAITPTLGDYTHANLGASWNAGFAKFFALYNVVRIEQQAGDVRKQTVELGVQIPITAQSRIRASYLRLDDRSSAALVNANGSQRNGNDARQFGVGVVHDLSKRTALYGTYAKLQNRGQATYVPSAARAPLAGRNVSALELGVRHAF
ncbi:porin [Hydrogenophaga sp. 2FB]|uniref:porin n=1 Tax=Hydrogenophaga sp. 2FB TaxID=2502187 RepID=UPI0010F6AEF4|nr:porin [Hydrogenophaga sp. 2FB]